MTDSTWHQLAAETHLVIHIEQVTGGAAVVCEVDGCRADADLLVTSEPDMEPGFVCRIHAFGWIRSTVELLQRMFPLDLGDEGGSV